MANAKFRLDFEVDTYHVMIQDERIALRDNSQVIFYKPENQSEANKGSIFFEIEEADELTASAIGEQKVNQLLNCMSVTFPILSLEHIKFSHPTLLNRQDFKRVKTFISIPATGRIVAHWKSNLVKDAEDLYNGINNSSQNEQDIISRSFRWFRKASETRREDRFIFRWIAFETLLGLLGKKKATQNLIVEFVNRYFDSNQAKTIAERHCKTISALSEANLTTYHGINYSFELKERLEKNCHARDFLPQASKCIFEIRNNLFHVGLVPDLMADSCSLLEDIYSNCLRSYILQRLSGN